jgi:hypothetical protein
MPCGVQERDFRERLAPDARDIDRCLAAFSPAVQPTGDSIQLLQIGTDAARLHFVQTDTLFGGMHEILTVAKHGDDRDSERVEKPH